MTNSEFKKITNKIESTNLIENVRSLFNCWKNNTNSKLDWFDYVYAIRKEVTNVTGVSGVIVKNNTFSIKLIYPNSNIVIKINNNSVIFSNIIR